MKVNRALVLAPHTDDGEMGCGATVARLLEEGAEVVQLAFSTGNPQTGANVREWEHAMTVLGIQGLRERYTTREFSQERQRILDRLVKLRDTAGPFDVVFCPSRWDRHQDHQVIRAEANRAFRHTTVLGYEMFASCDGFHPQCLWPVERRHVERKWAALLCYKSQQVRTYMKREMIWGLACIRGMQAGVSFAEGFEVIRWVQP